MNRIWIVEMWDDTLTPARWQPTHGVSLTRAASREELKGWREWNVSHRFRIRRYVSSGKDSAA